MNLNVALFELCQERFLNLQAAKTYLGCLVGWSSTVVLSFLVESGVFLFFKLSSDQCLLCTQEIRSAVICL